MSEKKRIFVSNQVFKNHHGPLKIKLSDKGVLNDFQTSSWVVETRAVILFLCTWKSLVILKLRLYFTVPIDLPVYQFIYLYKIIYQEI